MLISIAYADLTWWVPHTIAINMILHTVFTMFVDFKTGCRSILRQHRKEVRSSTGCEFSFYKKRMWKEWNLSLIQVNFQNWL